MRLTDTHRSSCAVAARAGNRPRRIGVIVAALVAGVALTSAGCASSPSSPPSPPASIGSGQLPSAGATSAGSGTAPPVEVNPPGDIPDNQAFVPYTGAGFTVSVPEGWARTTGSAGVVFSDKYNSVTVATASAPAAPTPTTVRSMELPSIQAVAKGFVLGTISTVQRKAGPAVLLSYQALSAVNPVTGKVANEAVERYEFWRNGQQVVLILAAPVGSDNLDPWRTVTDSFTWR